MSSYSAKLSGIILSDITKEMVIDIHSELSRANRAEAPNNQSPEESAAYSTWGADSRLSDILHFVVVEIESSERCTEGTRSPKPAKFHMAVRNVNCNGHGAPRYLTRSSSRRGGGSSATRRNTTPISPGLPSRQKKTRRHWPKLCAASVVHHGAPVEKM
ncbi:hypothetical protein HPB48_020847 [Haemaphysalis longicornis]|uniref:Uncharacterized protein n=1 Tax=Haemaphysalis longicornis TaxID=44386 RepID=A0A9J6GV25_HAELO|nr:hypothetical protein HPB48_020847 [Haemaphysalis longicornis]